MADENQNSVFLPEDLVTEVLLRLHLKPLFRFKTVSKQWNAIISDPKFGKKYMKKSLGNPKSYSWHLWGIVVSHSTCLDRPSQPDLKGDIDSVPPSLFLSAAISDPPYFDIVGYSHGLVVYRLPAKSYLCNGVTVQDFSLAVANPLTKQSVRLPGLSFPVYEWCIGFATIIVEEVYPVSYKVILTQGFRNIADVATMMLFCSEGGNWTYKDLINCPRIVFRRPLAQSCNGILYWLDLSANTPSLVTYDPYYLPDNFLLIQLPGGPSEFSVMNVIHLGHENILKYGDIHVLSDSKLEVSVWRLIDCTKGEWSLEKTLAVSEMCYKNLLFFSHTLIAPLPWNDDLICYVLDVGNTITATDLRTNEEVLGRLYDLTKEEVYSFVYQGMEVGYPEKVDELCDRYSIEVSVKAKGKPNH